MDAVTYLYILVSLAFALQIATSIVLVRGYLRTRAVGFVWLAVAAVVWPVLTEWPQIIIDHVTGPHFDTPVLSKLLSGGQMTSGMIVLLLFYLKYLIGVSLLLGAVVYLCRTKTRAVDFVSN